MSTLIADLKIALAGDSLSGLDASEACMRLPHMDVEALWRTYVDTKATLARFFRDSERAHAAGRLAVLEEEARRRDVGLPAEFDVDNFLKPPLDSFVAKWADARLEIERMRHRVGLIRHELESRFCRGELSAAVASQMEKIRAAARAAVNLEQKECKSCGHVTVVGDQFELRKKALSMLQQLRKETGFTIHASLVDLADQP
jgi:hypothetical protein